MGTDDNESRFYLVGLGRVGTFVRVLMSCKEDFVSFNLISEGGIATSSLYKFYHSITREKVV